MLRSAHGPEEIEQLVDLISTNHTRFFREPEHFTFLTGRMLPELVPRLAAEGAPLRVWSAAASSGEEPYTLAIVLAEFFREQPALDWQVEASDISHRMLEHARRGIYRARPRATRLPPELLRRYFQRGVGRASGTCRVKAELRERVRFPAHQPVPGRIPGAARTARDLLPQRHDLLRSRVARDPGAETHPASGARRLLVIGHSESLLGIRHDLESVRQSVFRKP